MNDLKTYFSELTAYEGSPARKLISPWSPENIKSITNDFRAAANKCQVQFDVPAGISDSALGNRVEKEAANGFNKVLQRHSLSECPGKGYPDQLLRRLRDDHLFVFELKAKTSFDRTDSNRIVLTSATGKLRRHFARTKPICHLLATALFRRFRRGRHSRIVIVGLRLDFLLPSSPVLMRFEASVSKRLLIRGRHASRLLIPAWARRNPRRYHTSTFSAHRQFSPRRTVSRIESN